MKTKILGLLAVALLAGPMAANAALITTSAGTYDVTTITGTFDALSSTLSEQIWWGDSDLAREFSNLTSGVLGVSTTNSAIFGRDFGALFVVCSDTCLSNSLFPVQGFLYDFEGLKRARVFATNSLLVAEYAIATRVPEPGTLALLGLGLVGMGYARRRKAS